jgi:hypothetical protein
MDGIQVLAVSNMSRTDAFTFVVRGPWLKTKQPVCLELYKFWPSIFAMGIGHAEEALARMRDITAKVKLTVNETKTRVCKLPEERFDLLSPKTGRAYIGDPVAEACSAHLHLHGDERANRAGQDSTGPRDASSETQLNNDWVGQLLLCGSRYTA